MVQDQASEDVAKHFDVTLDQLCALPGVPADTVYVQDKLKQDLQRTFKIVSSSSQELKMTVDLSQKRNAILESELASLRLELGMLQDEAGRPTLATPAPGPDPRVPQLTRVVDDLHGQLAEQAARIQELTRENEMAKWKVKCMSSLDPTRPSSASATLQSPMRPPSSLNRRLEMDDLRAQLGVKDQELTAKSSALTALAAIEARLRREVQDLKLDKGVATQFEVDSLKEDLEKALTEAEELREALDHSRSTCRSLQATIARLEQLEEAQIAEVESLRSDLQAQLHTSIEEATGLRAELREHLMERRKLETVIARLEQDHRAQAEAIQDMVSALALREQNEHLYRDAQLKGTLIARLNHEDRRLRAELDQVNQQCASITAQLRQVSKRPETDCQALAEAVRDLRHEALTQSMEIERLQTQEQLHQLRSELPVGSELVQLFADRCDRLTEAQESLKLRDLEIDGLNRQIKSLRLVTDLQDEAAQQRAEMEAQHVSRLNATVESLAELQDEREGLRSALESRQCRSSALATQLANAEELHFEASLSHTLETERLQTQLQAAHVSMSALREERDGLEQTVADLMQDLSITRQRLEDALAEVAAVTAQYEDHVAELHDSVAAMGLEMESVRTSAQGDAEAMALKLGAVARAQGLVKDLSEHVRDMEAHLRPCLAGLPDLSERLEGAGTRLGQAVDWLQQRLDLEDDVPLPDLSQRLKAAEAEFADGLSALRTWVAQSLDLERRMSNTLELLPREQA
uniref:Uncharacterized protein n=1 Tax=Eutreptiella gymnastica TaxID=73025 RepID=A0A7S1JCI8_9EUGL